MGNPRDDNHRPLSGGLEFISGRTENGTLVAAALLSAIVIAGVLLLPPSVLWHIGNVTTATQVYR